MFTLNQVKQAHSKVKSGADFPAYIVAIKTLGVVYYQTYVTDGHFVATARNHGLKNGQYAWKKGSVRITIKHEIKF